MIRLLLAAISLLFSGCDNNSPISEFKIYAQNWNFRAMQMADGVIQSNLSLKKALTEDQFSMIERHVSAITETEECDILQERHIGRQPVVNSRVVVVDADGELVYNMGFICTYDYRNQRLLVTSNELIYYIEDEFFPESVILELRE